MLLFPSDGWDISRFLPWKVSHNSVCFHFILFRYGDDVFVGSASAERWTKQARDRDLDCNYTCIPRYWEPEQTSKTSKSGQHSILAQRDGAQKVFIRSSPVGDGVVSFNKSKHEDKEILTHNYEDIFKIFKSLKCLKFYSLFEYVF